MRQTRRLGRRARFRLGLPAPGRQHLWVLPAFVVLALALTLASRPLAAGKNPAPAAPRATANPVAAALFDPLLWYRNSSLLPSGQVKREWYLIGGVGVNVVWVDITQAKVRCLVGLARNADPVRGYFPRDSFSSFIKRYRPRAAINGTYFHNLNGQPTGSIVRNGTFLYDGRWGTTITFDRQGQVRFHYRSGTYGRHFGWDRSVYNAITTGPTLVRSGHVWLYPWSEGFRDRHVLGTARRSAIGLTWNNKLVLVTVHTPISLNKLANIMLRFSCKAAANLDGGSSSALYCRGAYITRPTRRLSNVLLIYD